MSKRTRWLLGIGVIAALVVGFQVAAFAVHETGAFELEGNATNDPAVPGDDWDNVCHQVTKTLPAAQQQCKTAADTNGATAVDWVSEQDNLQSTIFTGGGSKDPNDINQWAYKDGSVPDKDNLLHSFAARYSLTSTGATTDPDPGTCPVKAGSPAGTKCEVLYFGSDRFDNSGDAQQGFWFFQNEVGLGTNNVGGGKGFTGVHKTGDLLIVSDFSNGGTTSTISVYSWVENASDHLKLEATSAAANCGNTNLPESDAFCGIVNPASGPGITNGITPSPWTFLDKSGNTGFANGEFYEGGVNLSALGLGNKCFSSVASETRSSTSTTATLKDFTLGKFGNCTSGTATHPVLDDANNTAVTAPVPAGTAVKDSATITVSGVTSWTGTLKFFLCKVDAPATCTTGTTGEQQIGATQNITQASTQPFLSAAVNTAANPLAPGRYCFRADFSGDPAAQVPASSDSSATECFTVQGTSSMITTQSLIPNDTATITTTGTPAPALNGTVEFKLYDTAANCQLNGSTVGSGGLLYKETLNNVTSASGTPLSTNNDGDGTGTGDTIDGYSITGTGGTVFWRVTYTPAAAAGHSGSESACTEQSTVTITN